MQWIYWLIAVLLSAGAAYWVYRTDKRRAVPYPRITSLLRGLVIFFTVLLVLVPSIQVTQNIIEKPVILLLQDNSASVGVALGADSAAYRRNTEGLLQKLSAQYKVVQWGFGNTVRTDSIFNYNQPATDISAALTRAREFYGMQNLGAVILASDGRFNQGSNPLYLQAGLHGTLYTVALGDSTQQKDIRITQVYANKTITLNSSFEIRADVVASLCKGYDHSLELKEVNNTMGSVPVTVNTDKYDRAVSFTLKAEHTGLHHYILTIPAADGEQNTTNNRKDIFVDVVDEKKNILIASAAPHPDLNAIREALAGIQSYKISVFTEDNFPASLSEYDVIILHGLPSIRSNIAERLLAAKKPVWFILSNQSGIAAINSMSSLTNTNLAQSQPHDVLPTFNPAFNTFTLPPQIQAVTDKMPPLIVNVSNILAPPGTNAIFTQKTGVGDMRSPLWLLQQGSVPFAYLAGEGLWRWRLYEFKNFGNHNVIDECIRQTVAFLGTANSDKPFSVSLPKAVWSDQEAVFLKAYLRNANNEPINTPEVSITITDSAGNKRPFSFERLGNAYSLNIGIWAGGAYTYTAQTTYNSKNYTTSGSFAVQSVPLEFMEQGADYNLLYSLARQNNGGFVTAPAIGSLYDSITTNQNIKPLIQTNTETVPFVDKKWYFFIILALAAAEWLLRKYWLAQ